MMSGVNTHLPTLLPNPSWVHPLYHGKERAVLGPLLVDGTAAQEANQLDAAHDLCRALRSRLHVSFMYSTLSAEEMLKHLHQFTRVWLSSGEAMFLRFADCRVLSRLPAILTQEQWRAFTAPLTKWDMHLRDGTRHELALAADDLDAAATPLVLSDAQTDALALAGQPDQLIEQLREEFGTLPGNLQQQHDWASGSLAVWKQVPGARYDSLLVLVEQAFKSEGRVLRFTDLPKIVAENNAVGVESILTAALKRTANAQR